MWFGSTPRAQTRNRSILPRIYSLSFSLSPSSFPLSPLISPPFLLSLVLSRVSDRRRRRRRLCRLCRLRLLLKFFFFKHTIFFFTLSHAEILIPFVIFFHEIESLTQRQQIVVFLFEKKIVSLTKISRNRSFLVDQCLEATALFLLRSVLTPIYSFFSFFPFSPPSLSLSLSLYRFYDTPFSFYLHYARAFWTSGTKSYVPTSTEHFAYFIERFLALVIFLG